MNRPLPAAILLVPLLLAGPALAQSSDPNGPGSNGTGPNGTGPTRSTTAPRDPGGATAGTNPASQSRMDTTVDRIDRKLLDQEKTRPNLPGQAPSPSQTQPGGVDPAPH